MKRLTASAPTTIGECEVGMIVRTLSGLWVVSMVLGGHRRWGRRVERDTLKDVCEPVRQLDADEPVLQVLRDQSYYRTHQRAGGVEFDPLK